MLAERGLAVDTSCVWRWVQAYAPELNKRCRPHLRLTNKSYRIDYTAALLPYSNLVMEPSGVNPAHEQVFAPPSRSLHVNQDQVLPIVNGAGMD